MAAPAAPTSTVSGASSTTNSTSYTPSMSTGSSGRKVVRVSSRSNGAMSVNTSLSAAGWNLVDQWVLSTTLSVAIFWKDATGSDTLVVTSATSTQFSHIATTEAADTGLYVMPTQATGTSSNPNPPAFDFKSARDFRFEALVASQGTGVPSSAPSGYSSLTTRAGGGANGASTSIAYKSATAAQTEDPGTFTQSSSTWLCLTIGFFTIPADRLANIKGALQSPTANPVILAIGTSHTAGAINNGAGGNSMAVNNFLYSRPSVWASGMTALPAAAWMVGNGGLTTTTNTSLNAYNNRFSAGASMSTTDQAATVMMGKGAPYVATGGQKISHVIPQAFDRIKIWVLAQPGGPSGTIDVNGGTTQAVTAWNGTLGYASQTFSLSGSAGATVNITPATAGGAVVAVEAYMNGVYQAQIFNAGWYAGNSNEMTSTAAAYSPLNGILALAPKLLVIEPSCNDGLAGLAIAQIKANIRTLILTGFVSGDVMYSTWPYTSTAEEAAIAAFAAIAKAVCDELGAQFFNIQTKTNWTAYTLQTAAGYSASGDPHELAAGYASWGGFEVADFDPGPAIATGTASITEASDASTATGTSIISGASSATEASDTTTASGKVAVAGPASITEASDTSAATGQAAVVGAAALTEADDTATATGVSIVAGAASITEDGDTVTATGTVPLGGLTGSASITEADDTSSATGVLPVQGALSVTEDSDTATATGALPVGGVGSGIEASDTAAATGVVLAQGAAAIPEADDTLTASGGGVDAPVLGSASIVEASDTAVGAGVLLVAGAASLAEASDTAAAIGVVHVRGAASPTEANDTAQGAAATTIQGSGAIYEQNDVASAAGFSVITGGLSTTEAGDTVIGVGVVGVMLPPPLSRIAYATRGPSRIAFAQSGPDRTAYARG